MPRLVGSEGQSVDQSEGELRAVQFRDRDRAVEGNDWCVDGEWSIARAPRPVPANRLSRAEREQVLAVLNNVEFVGCTPLQIYAMLLDRGQYLCSVSTMYRVLAEHAQVKDRRRLARHPARVRPELVASGPGEVLTWDITKLRGPVKGSYYDAYVMIDIYSRHTINQPVTGTLSVRARDTATPEPVLHVHLTTFRYTGTTDPSAPGGIAAVHRDLAADQARLGQVVDDITAALRENGHDPVTLRGGMGAKARATALARLDPPAGGSPLLIVATGSYIGEGFDCPALDTLFLAAPIAFKGRLVQYVGRVLRPFPGKTTAEVHDYHDTATGVLASSLAKRAPGYTSLGFPDPRRLT